MSQSETEIGGITPDSARWLTPTLWVNVWERGVWEKELVDETHTLTRPLPNAPDRLKSESPAWISEAWVKRDRRSERAGRMVAVTRGVGKRLRDRSGRTLPELGLSSMLRIGVIPPRPPKGHFRPKRISQPLQHHTSRTSGAWPAPA